MDYTQQTIAQITADFTELAHDLHDKGAINEWKLKELLDLGMALAKPNHTAAGRKSGPELVDENEKLSAMHSQVMVWCKGLLNGHVTLRKHRDELMAVNTLIRKDKEWKCRTIKTLLATIDKKNKRLAELGEFARAPSIRAAVGVSWRRHLGLTRGGRTRSGRPFRRS